MKRLMRSFVAALLFTVGATASAGNLGSEILISTDANLGSQYPEVAYYGNTIHVVWVGYATGKLGDIFYSRSTNNGAAGSWSTPVNLSANATAATGNDRPQVTAGANGVVVGWNSDNNTGAIYVRSSADGGANFSATQLVAGVEGGFYSRITHLFTDSGGNVHLAYYDDSYAIPAGSAGMVRHRMSCNGGQAWGTDTGITSTTLDGVFDNEEPRVGESGGKIHVIYRSSARGNPQGGWPPYTVLMKTGTVSNCALTGITYPARRIAGGVPLSLASTYRPEVVGETNGTLHMAWWDNGKGANVAYRKGNAGTGALGAVTAISNFGLDHLESGALTSTPALAAGGFQTPPALVTNGTTAVIGYQKNETVSGGRESGPIYLRESGDNGATWGPEIPVAGTSQAATPRTAIGGSGNQSVAVVWTDNRNSATPYVYFRMYSLGAATSPQLSITPSPQDFGSVAVGASASRTLQVVNVGIAGTVTFSLSGDFSTGNTTCSSTIGAGASCTYTVNFNPSTLGARMGTLKATAGGAETIVNLTGTGLQAAQGSAQNRLAVIRGFYETILGRTPDAAGVDFWNNEATRVTGLGADVREVFFALSVQFFSTPEYLNRNTSDTQYLTDLYKTFFLREPDSAGMAYWQSQLTAGMDRGALLTNFLFSTEFSNKMTNLFGNPTIRPEINMTIDLYRGILGVLPDSAGFNFWLGQIRTAQCQGSAAVAAQVSVIADGFINSAEYAQREAARPAAERNKRHIGDLYNAFLRRGADLPGYQFWAGQLDTGAQTRAQVRAEYIKSPEFQGRVSQVVAAGCAS